MAAPVCKQSSGLPWAYDSDGSGLDCWLAHAHGTLLLHNIAKHHEHAGKANIARPRGWLAGFTRGEASGAAPAEHPAAPPAHSSGFPAPSGSSPSSAIVPTPDLAAFAGVPVPIVFLGVLPTPIPPGRPTLNAEALLSSLQQGVLPSDTLPEVDREVWRAASRITDSISSFNICQAQQLGRRKLILTERGVAEQLARGTIQMVPVQGGVTSTARQGAGFNPFAPLQRLASQLSEGQHLSRQVQQRADALVSEWPGRKQGGRSEPAAATSSTAPASSSLAAVAAQEQPEPQYSLQDLPARRLLASGTPPQLAWVPLRVALQLLRALPQHFVILQDGTQQSGKQKQQQGHQGKPSHGGTFNTATSPGDLEVHILPGLHVRQVAPDGSAIEFTPAFLCSSQVQALWRDLREISGGAMLMHRRLERAIMRHRLEAAVAVIAGGGSARGPQASSSAQDEEEGSMEEPPEVSDFIRELGGSLTQDSGATLGGGAAGSSGQAPSGLSRLTAMFATGVVSLAAQGLSWAGNTADWLMMATPLGPRLLGVPEAAIQHRRLSDLLRGCQQYNREQAVLNARFGPSALALHLQQQQQEEKGPADASAAASSSSSSDTAAAAASTEASRHREEKGAKQYSKALAAAAIWLALSSKNLAEGSGGLGGTSLNRLLARAFMQQKGPGNSAVVGGGGTYGLSTQMMAALPALPQAAPQANSMQEAVEYMLATGLPMLEHNGFQFYFESTTSTVEGSRTSSSSSNGGASSRTSSTGRAKGLAAQISEHCTGDTQVGLGTFVQDGVGGGFSMLSSNPLEAAPGGRGLILVGDLDLKPRQRGRSAGRTAARFVIAGVDDGLKLL